MSTLLCQIHIPAQEDLAWFRDNLMRAGAELGLDQLQASLFAAQVSTQAFAALRRGYGDDAIFQAQVSIDSSAGDKRLHVLCQQDAEDGRQCVCDLWSPPLRALRNAVIDEASLAQPRAILQRKSKTQLTREILEQNEELKRRLQAVNVAERATEAKSAFLANMSHELRTPLNSILGFTRRLIRRLDGKVADKDLQALQTVDRNGKHLLSLINDILDLSKIEAGKDELNLESFSLRTVIQEVVAQCEPLVDAQRPVRWRCPPGDALDVLADPTKIRQILLNLVSNAIKYGGSEPVMISAKRQLDDAQNPQFVICVKDRGDGIPQEQLDNLFTPFSRLKTRATRKAGGTGLGLAICASYANLHGGRIDVQSQLGLGTTFSLVLPQNTMSEQSDEPTEREAA